MQNKLILQTDSSSQGEILFCPLQKTSNTTSWLQET